MTKLKSVVVLIVALVAGFVTAAGCGGDDSFTRVEVPELVIEGTSTGQLDLELPPDDARPQVQQANISIRNAGKAPLKITKLSWIAKPDRLEALAERGGDCSSDEDCGSGSICIINTCAALGLDEAPITVDQGLLYDIEFVIKKGEGELDCPAPPSTLPDDVFAEFYCGELRIESNATNSSGIVENGATTIYFLRPDASGEIKVNPNFLEFEQVQPGGVYMQTFSVQNTGSQPLTVKRIFMQMNASFFKITGSPMPVDVEAGASETWTLTVEIPDETPVEDYEGFNTMVIESTAINSSSGNVSVSLSAGAGSSPLINVQPKTLKFDAAPNQTLTIANDGNATLQVSSLLVQPVEARQFYKFFLGGVDVTEMFQTQNVVKGSSMELEVRFERPTGVTDSPVGELLIGNNDASSNFRATVTLLGDAGDVPIAKIYPQGFTFLSADGNNETRTFVIRNVGTADLMVNDVSFMFNVGSEAEFTVSNFQGTIPPGGLKSGTVTFAGVNAAPDNGLAVFGTNDMLSQVQLSLKDIDSVATLEAVVTPLFANDARVGVAAAFSATDSTPAGSGMAGIWTLTSRPAASTVFFNTTGEELRFVPDVAGNYQFTLQINQSQREDQVVYDLTVTE